jgi:bifunctional non-homologous end joining protein LigD
VPLAWDELSPSLRPDHYTLKNVRRRLEKLAADPWKKFFELKQSLPR